MLTEAINELLSGAPNADKSTLRNCETATILFAAIGGNLELILAKSCLCEEPLATKQSPSH